jgi:3-deoxy-D-arabino-heptulosonate 7-phosphate (DAHP) synthase
VTDQPTLAECRICHLLVRSELYGTTICDHCLAIETERAVMNEILDRQHERHHTGSAS